MARTNSSGSIAGRRNLNLTQEAARLLRENVYRDLSTVWVTPAPKTLDPQVVFQSWLTLAVPANQKFQRVCIGNAEVAAAYNAAVEMILNDQIQWKYMLTVEHDNLPPRDGLLKLFESIDYFDAVGGLYWLKGENGHAMIYGDPNVPGSFIPQVPKQDTVQACNGLGMGFTLFNVDMFRKMPKPWFKTDDLNGATQDLHFFEQAAKHGYKFACDTRVKVGHKDLETGEIW